MKYDLLKSKILEAMKSKNTMLPFYRYLDSLVQNESMKQRKEITDDMLVLVFKSELKKITENSSPTKDQEILFLNQFLPKILTENETKIIIEQIIKDNNFTKSSFSNLMKFIKTNYTEISMQIASKIAGELLK